MRRVLVVDDDEDLLFIIGEFLDSCEVRFDMASSAAQARKLLAHCRYGTVISDFNMPGESGLDLYRSVSLRYPEVHFTLMSANLDQRLRREAMAMGIRSFLSKPFDLADLKNIILNAGARSDKDAHAVAGGAPAA
jgi:DNA-binding NtrC family response regulator